LSATTYVRTCILQSGDLWRARDSLHGIAVGKRNKMPQTCCLTATPFSLKKAAMQIGRVIEVTQVAPVQFARPPALRLAAAASQL
jgi:hypothetical protein